MGGDDHLAIWFRRLASASQSTPRPTMSQLVKKKIDSRIRTLIENGVQERHRSFFVIVGDRGKDQVRLCPERCWACRSLFHSLSSIFESNSVFLSGE